LSIEEKYDEIRQLITMGKEKGYLLYDEVNELLPADITSSEELDDLFSTFGSQGIEVVDSEKTYRDDKLGEGAEESDLDLTPGTLDKTNDPVRMYLREMGTVPLLTREGEVAIAKRIEQGKLAVIKSISRTPKITHEVIELGEQLKRGERTVRELVVFNEEEITDEKIAARQRELVKQIDRVKVALEASQKLEEKYGDVPKSDKRKFRRAKWRIGRAKVEISRAIRKIEFTEMVKRRLIDGMKMAVEDVQAKQRDVRIIDQKLESKSKRKLREEEKKLLLKHKDELR
jgi:RNA polymerase primary sigma factor